MYTGRFAPSPTGKLHIGSLYTAMASYCDAMKNEGQWLVRMEDLDPPREVSGAAVSILKTLKFLGFEFCQQIVFQSHIDRQQAYQKALDQLKSSANIYYCTCSRTQPNIDKDNNHLCLQQSSPPKKDYSIKIRVEDRMIKFSDSIQGIYHKQLRKDCGDFILKRKDGLFSYQLAVVVDDEFQEVDHIIRGIDLIDSTPWQLYLIEKLGFNTPSYSHLPILVNQSNQKLSKQTFAEEIPTLLPLQSLMKAYQYLNQTHFSKPPKTIEEFWNHAIDNWNRNKIPKLESIQV